jgi:hypothetical protein
VSVNIEGSLILGWEVEVWEAENYEDGWLTDEAEERLSEVYGSVSDLDNYPLMFWSLYEDCDCMWVGLKLMDHWSLFDDVGEYGKFLMSNAELLTKTAHEIYKAVMGKPAEDEPVLMCVGSMG